MIYLVLIPLTLLFAPWVAVRYIFATKETARLPYSAMLPYMGLAAALWVAAFFVPNIPISNETSTFSQHAMGGVVAAVLFLAVSHAYQWRFGYWWQQIVCLYFFVSGLGVANELFELFATKSGIFWVESSDVWWDLLANTVGGIVAFGVYKLVQAGRQ